MPLRAARPTPQSGGRAKPPTIVGIFPDDPSLIRLATMLAIEQNDEWLVGRRYLSAGSERLHRHDTEEAPELQAA